MKAKAENGIVRVLKAEGVEWVSTYPINVMNNPTGEEGLKNLMMRTDRTAVAVADGFSRCSDGKRFGVCSVQGGMNAVGAQMAYGAIAQAFEDSSPILCLTDGVAPDIFGVPRFDISNAFQGITKWTGYLNKPHRVPELMTRAYTCLKSGRPGPVLLQVPKDLGEYDEEEWPYVSVRGWKSQGDPRDVEVAIMAVLEARKPMIYAGQGVFYANACAELLKLAEILQVPVMTSLKAKSAFPEDNPLSLGAMGGPAERFLKGSDLILAIGSGLYPGGRYGGFKHQIPGTRRSDLGRRNGKLIIQCDADDASINRYYEVDHAVVGDAKLVLTQLIEEASKRTGPTRASQTNALEEIEAARREDERKYAPLLNSNERPINPYRAFAELMETVDKRNSFVTHDSGSIREQLVMVYKALIPHGFMGWGTVSTLGFGLGASIGAKLAFPDRQVVSVTGDAGVAFQMGDYEALVRNKIGITTVHINNSGFSGYGPGPWGKGRSPYTWEVTPSSVQNLASTMESMGLKAERVNDPDEVGPALKRALKHNSTGTPAYLELICGHEPLRGWLAQ